MKRTLKKYLLFLFFFFGLKANAKEIILIRHAKVNHVTKGWMSAKKATRYNSAYDTATICPFLPDTVLAKIPERKSDIIYTSQLSRSIATAYRLYGDSATYFSTPLFNEFELQILWLPLFLPYKAWTISSRIGWFIGMKRPKIENHSEARKRIKRATDFIEERSNSNEQVILVMHGFINWGIAKELKKRGWDIIQNEGKYNLGATVLVK